MFGPKSPKIVAMRYLLLCLLIPIAIAHAVETSLVCQDLKTMANQMQREIQRSRVECDKLPEDALGSTPVPRGMEDYKCKDLSAIEARLKSLESELAMIKGLESVRKEIIEGQKNIAEIKRPELIAKASETFLSNLAIAETMELMLATNGANGKNVFSELADRPAADWDTPGKLKPIIEKFCVDNQVPGTSICSGGKTITQESFLAIRDFVGIGQDTQKKFKKGHIKDLQDALSITKEDDKEYSFNRLAALLKDMPRNGELKKEQMDILKSMPAIKANKKFSYLTQLKEAKDVLDIQNGSKQFKFFLQDLKNRQEWELKSKLSVVLFEHSAKIPVENQQACLAARTLSTPIADCLAPLTSDANSDRTSRAIVTDLEKELTLGEKHLAEINKLMSICVPDQELKMPAECESAVTAKQADLIPQIQFLNAMKIYLLKGKDDRIKLYNYALAQLREKGCGKIEKTDVLNCYQDVGSISKEAVALSGAATDIIHILAKPDDETDITELCKKEDEKKDLTYLKRLCEIDEAGNQPAAPAPKNPDDVEASTDPGSRNPMSEAWRDLALLGAQTLGQMFAPPPEVGPNPYGPIYPPVNLGAPKGDIYDQLAAPYVKSGMTSYTPGLGLSPYGAGGAGSSVNYDFGGSSMFNRPPGY